MSRPNTLANAWALQSKKINELAEAGHRLRKTLAFKGGKKLVSGLWRFAPVLSLPLDRQANRPGARSGR
jgi:hypothetical protein